MRRRFDDQNCSVAQAPEALRDWWTLLLVREAFVGERRFADFEANLDISKNVLSARLQHLVAHGVLARVDAGVHGHALRVRVDADGQGPGDPLLALDRRSGRRIPRLQACSTTRAVRLLAAISRWRRGRGASRRPRARSVHLESAEMRKYLP